MKIGNIKKKNRQKMVVGKKNRQKSLVGEKKSAKIVGRQKILVT